MSRAIIYIGDARNMEEVPDNSVGVIITSPPYWCIKDYGVTGQIGYMQSLHEYLIDLSRVWKECWRVLKPGRRLCINIGDYFSRATLHGVYKIIPIHAEIIAQCEIIGFDYMGSIIWRKRTTKRPSGGATVMGSYPYPPNGMVEQQHEYILIFKKPAKGAEHIPPEIKEASKLTKEEWMEFFCGIWEIPGERQNLHPAAFPEEVPYRLIKMFSFIGETVLDPFIGSGTTAKVALQLHRNAIGYEIQPQFIEVIEQKVGKYTLFSQLEIRVRETNPPPVAPPEGYVPRVKNYYPPPNAGG